MPNPAVSLAVSDARLTGVLALRHTAEHKVSKSAVQRPPADIGVDAFEFWLPERRPGGRNLAMRFEPPVEAFRPENVVTGPERPTSSANAWVADRADESPWIQLAWASPRDVRRAALRTPALRPQCSAPQCSAPLRSLWPDLANTATSVAVARSGHRRSTTSTGGAPALPDRKDGAATSEQPGSLSFAGSRLRRRTSGVLPNPPVLSP
jgi:hypothetical protein